MVAKVIKVIIGLKRIKPFKVKFGFVAFLYDKRVEIVNGGQKVSMDLTKRLNQILTSIT